jgi:2,5-diketo-D-gluconate reductase A
MSAMPSASVPDVPSDSAKLPNGGQMPLLGFGTWQITGPDAARCTSAALRAGYRHIDTAMAYGNEAEVGQALVESGINRADLFITTKVPPTDPDGARAALKDSLQKLQTDYLDLWLIHWPGDGAGVDQWRVFMDAKQTGQVRDIGVSNYSFELIDELTAAGEKPAVNQIRWSPLTYNVSVVKGHEDRGIVLEGYSALRGGTLEHPAINEIANRLGRTAAQVIIRWHLQHQFVAIPKSQVEDRIISNADVGGFELSDADMATLDGLAGQ